MTFNEVIDKIMPEVQDGSKEPFIIFRDKSGDWNFDFTQNSNGETFDWVDKVKWNDPFASTFTGEEFSHGSFPMVYDRVMLERLRAEYEYLPLEKITSKLEACLNFLEENIGAVSSTVTDYIMRFDKPLAAINSMIPISLESPDPESSYYNEDKAEEAIKILENKVKDMITHPIDEPFGINAEKQIYEGYEEIAAIHINGRFMFIGENPTVEHCYMVSEYRRDNSSGTMESQWTGITADYVEALDKFRYLVEYNINVVKSDYEVRKNLYGVEAITLTNADCVPNGLSEDLTGKLIVIKPEALSPEYRRADYQLRVCTGGLGASSNASGRAVLCTELFIGKNSKFERRDILGVADLVKLPQWAIDKLSEYHSKQNEIDKSAKEQLIKKTAPQKPVTLQEKLSKAKERVRKADANNDSHGDKPKKRDERE